MRICPTTHGPASMAVTGVTRPSGEKTWVIPTFRPRIATGAAMEGRDPSGGRRRGQGEGPCPASPGAVCFYRSFPQEEPHDPEPLRTFGPRRGARRRLPRHSRGRDGRDLPTTRAGGATHHGGPLLP